MKFIRFLILSTIMVWSAVLCVTGVHAENKPTPIPSNVDTKVLGTQPLSGNTILYEAEVVDAADLKNVSKTDLSNTQPITIEIKNGNKSGTRLDTALIFPNPQFKRPLKIGDRILVESIGEISSNSTIAIISMYRQNNILVWSFILLGLFILVAGFKTNIRYFQIFMITVISGVIVLLSYHRNTYLTFGSLFLWQLLSTVWFAFRIFRKRTPSVVLSLCVLGNQFLAMGLVFIMKNINIFDTGFFELFFPSINDAREVMIYILALLVLYPISVVFAEQVISESIKKKREENDILKINLIRHVSRSALRNLNNIFLTFFGLFFAIFVGIVAISSREQIVLRELNSAPVAQILSVGFLILFNLLIFVPLVSFVSGMWLGTLESHELVTDKNLRQLEL